MKNLPIIIVAIAVLLIACKYPEKYNPLMNPQAQATACGLEIILTVGSILEQESTQARALVIFSDGKKRETGPVSWESVDADIIAVDQSGLITGLAPGRGRVRVRYNEMSSEHEIQVGRKIDYTRIKLSEIFYDAAGSDDGKEFIELCNDNGYACDISGMMVIDGAASSRAYVLPPGSIINPASHLVIALSADGFYTLFGSYPDCEGFTFALNNSGETVMLMLADGTVIDIVYIRGGTEDFIPDAAWGSISLPSAAAGESVFRTGFVDTDSCADWTNGPPSPGS